MRGGFASPERSSWIPFPLRWECFRAAPTSRSLRAARKVWIHSADCSRYLRWDIIPSLTARAARTGTCSVLAPDANPEFVQAIVDNQVAQQRAVTQQYEAEVGRMARR